ELGREDDPVAPAPGQPAPELALVLVGAIDFGRVEQGHPPFERLEEGGLAFRCVGAPIGVAHAHATEPDGRHFESLGSEPAPLHAQIDLQRTLTRGARPLRIRGSLSAEGYPSGQREQTVNLPAYAFVGSNPTPSTRPARRGQPMQGHRDAGMARVSVGTGEARRV